MREAEGRIIILPLASGLQPGFKRVPQVCCAVVFNAFSGSE